MLLIYPIFLFFSIDRGATRTRNRSTHAIFVFFSSTREGTDFQWMKLNALRPTFVRNRERLNGCEIGETIRSKDCDRGRSIERRQVRFQATTSFSLTAPCKIDPFTRCSTISLFVFFFSFPLPLPFFPLFFSVGCPILLCLVGTPHPSPNVESFHAWKLPRVPTSIACRDHQWKTSTRDFRRAGHESFPTFVEN